MIEHPFSQSWIQALTKVSENPLARTIKTKLEWIDRVSRSGGADELEQSKQAAQALLEFCSSEGLLELLQIMPATSSHWTFAGDDRFIYRRAKVTGDSPPLSAQDWMAALGLEPSSHPLIAEVTSSEWISLVRSEAVRLKHAFDTAAVPQGSTLQLPCTATWDGKQWIVCFDQLAWIQILYTEIPTAQRPSLSELMEPLMWLISLASERLPSKPPRRCETKATAQPWYGSVPALQPLHEQVFGDAASLSPWLLKTWNCVWPVVYREQSRLKEQADIVWIREEIKVCLNTQPRLTMWMFVFAKLVCQTQLGSGLGISVDYF